MNKVFKYIDIVWLSLLGLLLVYSITRHFFDGFVLTVNLYIGALCWLVVLLLRIFNNKRAKAYLICLIALAAFNVVSFTVENFSLGNGRIRDYDSISFVVPGVNPIFLFALVIYALTDYSSSILFYKRVLRGSDEEMNEEYAKQIKFYYDQFSISTEDELGFAIKNLKDYPAPAREALEMIISEMKDEEN